MLIGRQYRKGLYLDALYVWWNIWHTGELTKLYAYGDRLNILRVIREKSPTELYISIKDIFFRGFVNLTLLIYDFQSIKCYLMVFETIV